MSKMKLMAATLAMMAFAAVPAYAHTTVDASDNETNITSEFNGNNVAIQDASGGDGGDASADDNLNAQYNSGNVDQNAGDDVAMGGDGGDGGDNSAEVGDVDEGDNGVEWYYYPFFGGYYPLFF